MKYSSTLIFLVISILIGVNVHAQKDEFLTFYEQSGYSKTPDYDQTIDYCKELADASPWVSYTNFGKSPQGRELPLLIIDKDGFGQSREVRQTEKIVVLIQAGIHAGEINGKDAGLMLIRDIAITKKLESLLNNVTILFIPIYNVDGHEHFGPYSRINQNGPDECGWRTNASNLNLNRDFLKAEAPETQAWLKLFIEWLPEFFVDIHSTDGADYQYALTYGMETFGLMSSDLNDWQKNTFLKYVENKMEKADYPIYPYVMFRNWHDPRSGLRGGVGNPMLSQAYSAIQNRPGLLIESHMLKDYKTRVSSTYEMLIHSLTILNKESYKLKKMIHESEIYVSGNDFRANKFTLKWQTTSDSQMVDFKGVEYSSEKSDLTGGLWFQYSKEKKNFSIPYFNKFEPKKQVVLPEAYIIPAEWTEVIKRLEMHGIEIWKTTKESKINVSTYKFTDLKWSQKPYEGRQTLVDFNIKQLEETKVFPAGSVVVSMNQATAKVIAFILEPEAPGSFVYWGFFNPIFEQKEYGESYVMEKVAREMLEKDPALKAEFELKKKDNPDFANNQWEILNWFYSKTPYWDNRINAYPVGRILSPSELNKLEFTE
ncbi:M14 family metallopeptidase [Bacteroidota bacterium]